MGDIATRLLLRGKRNNEGVPAKISLATPAAPGESCSATDGRMGINGIICHGWCRNQTLGWVAVDFNRCFAARRYCTLITNASLKTYSVKDLAELAKTQGLSGWHSMKKDQLIRALMKTQKSKKAPPPKAVAKAKPAPASRATPAKPAPARGKAVASPAKPAPARSSVAKSAPAKQSASATRPAGKAAPKPVVDKAKAQRIARKIHAAHEKRDHLKDLSHNTNGHKDTKLKAERDRIVLMVRDPYWMHAMWQVNRTSVVRAQAAMSEHWHTARPVLRLIEVDAGSTTSTAERISREIEIHGGVQNWYLEALNSPKSYRVELGYKAASGKFFSIAKSNVVTTPAPGSSDTIDENWNAIAQDYEKIYALSGGYNEERSSGELQELFEERLRRPMGPTSSRYGMGAERLINRHKNFQFVVDAEMIVFGSTSPDARVTLSGEPVKLRPDGTFTVRLAMPDKRQVIPAVAASADGVEQRTVVLAVERNTKVLEPMIREQNSD